MLIFYHEFLNLDFFQFLPYYLRNLQAETDRILLLSTLRLIGG